MAETYDLNKANSLVIKERALIKAFNLNRFLSIPHGIVVLESECLFNQTSIEEVLMAETVTEIKNNAFEGCYNLRSINLSKNIEVIGRNAFSDCISLRVITLPPALKELRFGAFNGCKALREIKFSADLKSIEGAAFIYTRINTVQYAGSILDWLAIDFSNSMSNPLHKGAALVLFNSVVKDLVIPGEVDEIKKYAFYGCGSLRSVDVKEGVTTVGPYAFGKCSALKRVYLPKSVKNLGKAAFSGGKNMSITLSETLFEQLRKRRCPVCSESLPFYENQCKHCNTTFNVYEDK